MDKGRLNDLAKAVNDFKYALESHDPDCDEGLWRVIVTDLDEIYRIICESNIQEGEPFYATWQGQWEVNEIQRLLDQVSVYALRYRNYENENDLPIEFSDIHDLTHQVYHENRRHDHHERYVSKHASIAGKNGNGNSWKR